MPKILMRKFWSKGSTLILKTRAEIAADKFHSTHLCGIYIFLFDDPIEKHKLKTKYFICNKVVYKLHMSIEIYMLLV